jgi:UDP-MurNAc hydroxylase
VGQTSVIIDPWLLGSCYWRSWWNFPAAVYDEQEVRQVDAVVLSHIHWDHWHGPTIKRLLADRPFIIADEANHRSADDLQRIGISRITRAPHGKTIAIGPDLRVTLYQFGMLMSDSAIVLELGDVTVLNANDAKIAGWPLRALLRQHRPIDLAMRSHSSANARACFKVDGELNGQDESLHYARSFQLFMDAVQPRFAVPFASNHCYLHRDTLRFNALAVNPLTLQRQLQELGGLRSAELVVMPPGSRWNPQQGFDLTSAEAFRIPDVHIAERMTQTIDVLARNDALEQRAVIAAAVMNRLIEHVRCVPAWLRRRSGATDVNIELTWPAGERRYLTLNFASATIIERSEDEAAAWRSRMRWPAAVFQDLVMKKMYSHGLISKRGVFHAVNHQELHRLVSAFGRLEQVEMNVWPFSFSHAWRLCAAYLRRWRELFVYAQAAFHIYLHKRPGFLVEELILRSTNRAYKNGHPGPIKAP